MAQESQLANRVVTSTALPYRSNISAIESDPCFVTGSKNIITSITGYAERRLGFSDNVEVTPTVFNNLQRQFSWNRFDGTFILMACDINILNQSVVLKQIVGMDNSYVVIFTDTSSNAPFDFTVSNNTVYFSNGNVAKKYDPINGVTNWGIAIGSVNNATGPNPPAAAVDGGEGFTAWTNPTNVEVQDGNFAILTIPAGGGNSNSLKATQFGFGIAASTTVLGIQVDVKGKSSLGSSVGMQMLKAGNFTGIAQFAPLPTVNGFITLGGPSDLWGSTWTPSDINNIGFGTGQNVTVYVGGSGIDLEIDFIRITIYGLGGPSVSLTGTGLTATVGYQYVMAYGNSNSGQVSSPSPASSVVKPINQSINVTLVASTDPQVNQMHVYRSTDSVAIGGNAGIYFEIPNSPFTNTNQTITDSAGDLSLNVNSIAPLPGGNDPPTPGRNPVYFSGRIWLFKDNRVFFSGLEETITGVPEESFPSGLAGNFWNFDQAVQALAVVGNGLNQALMIFCAGRIYGITGNSLDTFRRFLVSDRRGARNIKSVSSLGGMVAWRDTSGQVWATDGNSMQELSQDVRPDFTPYVPGRDSITFHTAGKIHWLLVSTGENILAYDLDMGQWMPPWTFGCNQLFSGEISAGNYKLLAATSSKALQLNDSATNGKYNDNGNLYQMIGKTQLFSVVPDYGKRFSYASMGLYNEPGKTGYATRIQIDTNNNSLADVLVAVDDDPTNSATVYKTIAMNKISPQVAYNRGQGINIIQNIYGLNQEAEGRWVSIQFQSQVSDTNDRWYDYFMSYKAVGGR